MDYTLFLDTNGLINLQANAFKEHFMISQKTLEEIESIKTSAHKDSELKYKCRNLSRLLDEHDGDYDVIAYNREIQSIIEKYYLSETPDNIILATAKYCNDNINEVLVCTDDLNCRFISKNIFGLKTKGVNELHLVKNLHEYKGFKDLALSDEEMSYFYLHLKENIYDCLMNEYLIIRKSDGEVVDYRKWNGEEYTNIKFPNVQSNYFGKIKPINGDIYQQMALNSFSQNQLTMIKGAAGTGKSYLALGYLMYLLEKHKIDKIVVFCNTVATANSAKLGFYPGSRFEKLLDSQIGNMLGSKLGGQFAVERLVSENKLELLPMSDIRGYDATGMNAGIYITEAQNMDISLMKLALQRIGEDSICIIDGDYNAQVDLSAYAGINNGMKRMSEVFRGQDFYGEIELQNIYRSKIAKIAESM